MALKTDYVDDELAVSMGGKRQFNIVDSNGNILYENVHIEDTSKYSTVGDDFGAEDINETNGAVNQLNTHLTVLDISSQLTPDAPVKTVAFKSMRRMGKVIEIDFTIVLNQALTHGNAIFGGVPKPASNGNNRFTFTASTSGIHTPIEFAWASGYLGAWYPQSGITGADSVITGHLMYIAE